MIPLPETLVLTIFLWPLSSKAETLPFLNVPASSLSFIKKTSDRRADFAVLPCLA